MVLSDRLDLDQLNLNAADLLEVQNVAKYIGANRYLLEVVDVFSKFSWVQPIKSKWAWQSRKSFERY